MIKPPRRPKGEDDATYMANQDKQITLLINRVEHLTVELAECTKQRESLEQSWTSLSDEYTRISEQLAKVQAANTRLLGFQDCSRELFQIFAEK